MISAEALAYNAECLGIGKPDLEYGDPSDFLTPTTMAACRSDGKAILLNMELVVAGRFLDVWLAISQGSRHAWQIQADRFDLSGYSDASTAPLPDYNLQEVEIDAHA